MGVKPSMIDDAKSYPEEPLVGEFRESSLTHCSDSSIEVFKDFQKTKLIITDPPYNLGKKYGGVNDSLSAESYAKLLEDTFDCCWDIADDDAHLFIIHYPDVIAQHWSQITKKWSFKQWISWVYPTNTGHSPNQWTTAKRAILWLTKGNPHFDSRAVTQRFKNPSVKVVKEKVAEGIMGVALYDWWEIPQVKNISHEYRGYENQIPFELLRRIILCSTKPGDWVGDPFSGSFSTARAALNLGRRGWGCDINSEVVEHWPKNEEWAWRKEDPVIENIDSDVYDGVLKHIPIEQLDNALHRLLMVASEDDLKKAIGPVNGSRVYNELHNNRY